MLDKGFVKDDFDQEKGHKIAQKAEINDIAPSELNASAILFAQAEPRSVQTRYKQSSLEVMPSTIDNVKHNWHESRVPGYVESHPALAGIATGAMAWYGINRWNSEPISKLSKMATIGRTALTIPLLGIAGAGIFKFQTDLGDFTDSKSLLDSTKFGLAAAADLSITAGALTRILGDASSISASIKSTKLSPNLANLSKIGTVSMLGAAIARTALELMPDSSSHKPIAEFQTESLLKSTNAKVLVPLESGAKEQRDYQYYVPRGYDGKKPLPMVLALHGVEPEFKNDTMEKETRLNELAEKKQMIVVYPLAKTHSENLLGESTLGKLIHIQAKPMDWNAPGVGGTNTQKGWNDVDYIKSVMNDVRHKFKVDHQRIYAMGFSYGGEFVQHLRGKMPNTFAGVASLHGTWAGTEALPRLGDQTAFVTLLSDNDQMLPIEGGQGLATSHMPKTAKSQPLAQKEVAKEANLILGNPAKAQVGPIEITQYYAPGRAPVTEFIVRGGRTGGMLGGLLGRGRDGIATQHAIDGTGAGGWPIVGEKNPKLNATGLIIDELLKFKKNDFGF